jgi:HNH endonuclease
MTRDELKQILHYDPETDRWTWLKASPRHQYLIGQEAGSLNDKGYHVIKIDGKRYYSSRLAWLYMTGEWPTETIDHKDRDPSNGRWDNLRPANLSEQKCNQNIRTDNTSGHKGIDRFSGSVRPFGGCYNSAKDC